MAEKKRMALSNGEDKCNFCRVSNRLVGVVATSAGILFPKLFLLLAFLLRLSLLAPHSVAIAEKGL